jgi:hypothetical protein
MMMRRRPLMRAAVVGGVAYGAGRHAANRNAQDQDQEARLEALEQQQQYQQAPQPEPAAAPAPAAAAPQADMVEQLTQLKSLLDAGALTQEEFDAAKAKLLAG